MGEELEQQEVISQDEAKTAYLSGLTPEAQGAFQEGKADLLMSQRQLEAVRNNTQRLIEMYRKLQEKDETQGVAGGKLVQYGEAIPKLEKDLTAVNVLLKSLEEGESETK